MSKFRNRIRIEDEGEKYFDDSADDSRQMIDLWNKVVLTAIKDAAGCHYGNGQGTQSLEQHRARIWFKEANEDFETVMELSGRCPRKAKAWAKKQTELGWQNNQDVEELLAQFNSHVMYA